MAMFNKNVNCSNKDEKGNILGIGGSGWYDKKSSVISNIDSGLYDYYVFNRTRVEVYEREGVKHIRTVPNNKDNDNLDNLNSCPL